MKQVLKKYLELYWAAILMVLSPITVFSQADIHFSQFYETSILRNPALTGVFADDYKLGIYIRNQWSSITNPYQTFLGSAETRFSISHSSQDFVSFGLLGFSDKAGSIDQSIQAFYPAVNYNKSINPAHNSYLSVGFTGGYIQYSFNPNKATFNNQYNNGSFDPNFPTGEIFPNPKMSFFDLGTGINYNFSVGEYNAHTFVFGVSGYHFTQPGFSYYNKPDVGLYIRWNGNAAASFTVNENLNAQVQVNYAQQNTYREIMAGGLVSWTTTSYATSVPFTISGGAYIRLGDALIPIVKLKYNNFALGISYDVNISTLREASNLQGGYEVTLFLSGNYYNKDGVLAKTVCPRF